MLGLYRYEVVSKYSWVRNVPKGPVQIQTENTVHPIQKLVKLL